MARRRMILGCGLVIALAAMAVEARAGAFTDGNILVSTDEVLYEYTPAGVFVQSFAIPFPGGGSESARDVALDADGFAYVYNGTFDPYVSKLDPVSGVWSHETAIGFSTVNNGTYGGIAAYGDYVFVTDMDTAGDGGADQAMGVIRFNQSDGTWVRFGEDHEPIDLNIGRDGLLYTLFPGGSPNGRTVNVYDPLTMAFIREIDLTATFGHTAHRSIAADDGGNIFVADADGDFQKIDADGTLLDSVNLDPQCDGSCFFFDVDVSADGVVALGSRDGDVIITDEDLSSFSSFAVGTEGTFVTIVPEPASLSMILLVGVFATRRKGRR